MCKEERANKKRENKEKAKKKGKLEGETTESELESGT